MKKNLSFILYLIALVIILIPVIMTEVLHNPMGQLNQTITMAIGAGILIAGKLLTIRKKYIAGAGSSIFQDGLIVVCLAAMVVWMFMKL